MSTQVEKYCGSCGALRNDPESKFCGDCGATFLGQPNSTPLLPPQEKVMDASRSVDIDGPPSQNKASNNYFSNAALGLAALAISLSGFFSFGAVVVALVSKVKGEKRANLAICISILSVIVSIVFGAAIGAATYGG
jgi:hypothetical protein